MEPARHTVPRLPFKRHISMRPTSFTTVVENIKGVKECTVDYEKGVATVVFDEQKLDSKDIVDVLTEKTSYKVSEMKQQDTKKETGSI